MVYKICFAGTHGTGKTSLMTRVEGALRAGRGINKVRRIEEYSTQAQDLGLPINQSTTLAAQLWIMHRHLAQEIFYSENRVTAPQIEVLLCDRGPDNYCYLKHHFGENKYALQMTLGHLKYFPYSRIYLLPIVDGAPLIADGTRSVNLSFQEEMDLEIRTFFRKSSLQYIELPQPQDNSRDEWVKAVVNQTLRDLHKPKKYLMK